VVFGIEKLLLLERLVTHHSVNISSQQN